MRVLFVSDLYSTPRAPRRGVGNARIVHAMREFADIQVISPVPWYPRAITHRVAALRALAQLPPTDMDDDGSTVLHPRRLQIPRSFASQAALYALSMVGPIRAEVRRYRHDVVMTAWAYPDATAMVPLAHALGLPVAVRVLGSDINDYAHKRFRRPQIARAMRRAERIIAVSKGLRDELVGLDVVSDRIVIVPTGVDREKFFPVDRDEARAAIGIDARPLIAVPARLAPEKGITVLLDALAGLPEAQCVLIGEGRQRFELHAQCARLGIAERVHFAGFQPESRIRLYASAADLVCLPSFEEGWPDAIMEAFSCGCPVVASAVGGVPEQIALTNCGLTAPPGDVDGLRLALRAALDRTWDRAACAAAMAKHTLTRTGERYVEVCAEAASVYRRR